MSILGDEELGSQFARNPEEHFAAVYRRYADPLFRFVFRFTANREAAEEILHDVFLEALAGKFRAETGPHLKAWLFTVARNKCLNHAKGAARMSEAPVNEELPSPATDAEALATERDLESRLSLAELRLPADLRETWSLRQAGLDYRQIAGKLSIPVGTVKSRFSRLVTFLKEELCHEN